MEKTLRTYMLFCIGLGASMAWWLIMSTNPLSIAQTEQSTMLVIHLCYFTVLLLCFLTARRLGPILRKKRTALIIGLIASGMSIVAFLPLVGAFPPEASIAALAIASAAKAALFLAWTMAFTALSAGTGGFPLMLGSMSIGWVFCLVLSGAPHSITVALACLLPTASSVCLGYASIASQQREISACVRGPASAPSKSIFPPLLIIGVAIYEFAPGFVTGTLQSDGDQSVLINTYAVVAILLCAAFITAMLLSKTRAWQRIQRFIVPLIAIGLLAIPLLNANEQALAFACVIAGTSLFDAFIYTKFAEISLASRTEPLRVFAFGQLVIQSAILVAFVLGMVLAQQNASWISAVCLLLVFFFVLSGRFDLYATGENTREEQSAKEVANIAVVPFEEFARTHGFSKRETEILGLIMRGKNAPAIAADLCIAPSTVKTHLMHMYQKAEVSSRQELVRRVDDLTSDLQVS